MNRYLIRFDYDCESMPHTCYMINGVSQGAVPNRIEGSCFDKRQTDINYCGYLRTYEHSKEWLVSIEECGE